MITLVAPITAAPRVVSRQTPSAAQALPTPPGEDGSYQPGERPAYIAVAFFGLYFLAGFLGHVVGLL